MDSIELLFLGTGTSTGIPMIGCHCETCTSADPHDRRMRPSVVISYGATRVVIDATAELRLQCVANGVDVIDAVVFTHAHADHIMGLDDLRRFNVTGGGALDLWADATAHAVLKRRFGYAFLSAPPKLGMFRPHLRHRAIEGPFQIGRMTWTPVPLLHGQMPVLGFRVGPIAYCTDVSTIPAESYKLLGGVQILVLDASQHKVHPNHFCLEQAVEAAHRVGAKKTYFTHISHALRHEPTNATLPPNIRLAYDGLLATADVATRS
ncbi:MAG: MBL fold metallo-hydrolase [Tepidisphaeraceae bacterium]|jgi:phosphoribosyl 1,2-cyclic phosphate phosphodiesterase